MGMKKIIYSLLILSASGVFAQDAVKSASLGKDSKKRKCSTSVADANNMVEAVLGPGVSVDRLSQAREKLDGYPVDFTVRKSKNRLFLNIKAYAFAGSKTPYYNSDVPIQVCQNGKSLTATLLLTDARAAKEGRNLADKYTKKNVVLSISRPSNNVLAFSGGDYNIHLPAGAK